MQTLRSFRSSEPLRKPYSRTTRRTISSARCPPCMTHQRWPASSSSRSAPLSAWSRAAIGSHQARAALDQTLEAMLASDLYDPLDALSRDADGGLARLRAGKPLALNALLALTLLESSRRAEAVRALDFLLSAFSVPGGMLNPCLTYSRESCAFYARTGLRRARRRGRPACLPPAGAAPPLSRPPKSRPAVAG